MSQRGGKSGYQPRIRRLRRQEKRTSLLYYLPIHDAADGTRLGVLGDLSREGLLLIGERSYPTGYRLQLQIRGDPGSELAGDVHVTLTAEVRWSAPDLNPNYTATGLHLHNPSAETRAALEQLLQRLGLLDEDTP